MPWRLGRWGGNDYWAWHYSLGESGFVGAQWQVDRRTLVATANFVHNGERCIALDLESGVPAVIIPHYLREGLRLGHFPLFDDTDFARLRSYIAAHAHALTTRLGLAKVRHLRHVVSALERHECLWKIGEVALLPEPRRWLRADGRREIRQQTVARWLREGHIGPESAVITVYTLTRWLKRPDLRFGTALTIGLVPKLSVLAYPVQLLTVYPELACFLVRDLAARLAERLPIYGGRHTLTEHYCIRSADVLLSCVHTVNRLLRGRSATLD